MSEEAYARNLTREVRIWKPFGYSFPFTANQTIDRGIIYGLYSGAYLNGQDYLQQIESQELTNLLEDYTLKLADLTNQEAIVVVDIVSKKYLSSIDKLIHNQKLITEQQKINNENALADARYAALAADRAALDTMVTTVATVILKNNARITELETMIQIEAVNLSETELEIAQKEVDSLKLDNQKLEVANEILNIQIQTIKTATELIDIDVQMARTQLNIAETELGITKIGLLANEVSLEHAQTLVTQAQIPISEARITLAQAKYNETEAELLYILNILIPREAIRYNHKESLLNLQHIIKEYELAHRETQNDLNNENRLNLSNLSKTLILADQANKDLVDKEDVRYMDQVAINEWLKVLAVIEAAKKTAAANITTTLTHTIGKAK